MSWSLMIHGGCGAMRPASLPPETEDKARAGLQDALAGVEGVVEPGARLVLGFGREAGRAHRAAAAMDHQ